MRQFLAMLVFLALLLGFVSVAVADSPDDSIGVGYREQVAERTGLLGLKHTFLSPDGNTFRVNMQTGVLERSVPGFDPHYKENVRYKIEYETAMRSRWQWLVTNEVEAYRDREVRQTIQRGSGSNPVNSFDLSSSDPLVIGQELVQRRGKLLVGSRYGDEARYFALQTGYAYDEDLRSVGRGATMYAAFRIDSTFRDAWSVESDANYRHSWLNPRVDGNGELNLAFTRPYPEGASIAIRTALQRAVRDIVGTNPFRRDEWHGQGLVQLRFPDGYTGVWLSEAEWEGARIRQGASLPSSSQLRQEYRLRWQLDLNDRFVTANYRIGYQNTRSGSQLQNDRSEGIELSGGWHPGVRDTLMATFEATATRTNTPDSLDRNDRDELRWRAAVNSSYRIFPGIDWQFEAVVLDLHNAFLSSYTSSANRRTRTYSLASGVEQVWRQGWHRFRGELATTYVLFDFRLVTQPLRDVVIRRVTLVDSISVEAGPGSLHSFVRTDFEDRGSFDRAAFEQALSESIQTLVTSVRYRIPYHSTGVSLGVSAYHRQPYRYVYVGNNNNRISETPVAGFGPTLLIERRHSSGWSLYGDVTLLTVSKSPQGRYMQNNVNLAISRNW